MTNGIDATDQIELDAMLTQLDNINSAGERRMADDYNRTFVQLKLKAPMRGKRPVDCYSPLGLALFDHTAAPTFI